MKKYLKIVLLVSMAVMFSKGLSTHAMEPSERDPKKIKLETDILMNNNELEISIPKFKHIINEEPDTWRNIFTKVQVLILTSGDNPNEKFSDMELRAMGNMVKLKSIRIIGGSEVYRCYNGILYSKDLKVLYFCPPNIGTKEIKLHKKTEFIRWQSIRRAEQICGENITLINGNIKNKRYKSKYNFSGNYDDGVEQSFDSNGYPDVFFGIKELSAAEKLKKERELHEHRKTVYPELSKCSLTPFKTLSAQLSCLPCKIGDKFSFDTPFGRVNCEKRKGKDNDNYYITPQGARVNTCYASMVKVITDIIKKCDGIDSRYVLPGMQKCKIINTIYNYINQPADPRIKNFEDFGRKKYDQSEEFVKDFKKKEWIKSEEFVKYLKGKECFRLEDMAKYIEEKECVNQEDIDKYSEELNTLAVFSAILMLSEPARNQMGGKYERAALREWLGHPDAMPSELRDRIIDFYRFSLRYFQGRKLLNDIRSLNLGESDISEEVSRITEEYRQKIDNINSDNPSDESLKRELKLKKVDEGTGSMEKIFDNDTFKGGDKLKVPYLMSLENGKDYLNNSVDGRCHNEDQKEAFEYLNRSISPVRDCDADVVYQVE